MFSMHGKLHFVELNNTNNIHDKSIKAAEISP